MTLFILGAPHYAGWGNDICDNCAVTLREFEDFFKRRIMTLFCAPKYLDLLAPVMSDTESLILLPDYDIGFGDHAFSQLKKHIGTLPRLRKLNFEFTIKEDKVYRDLFLDTFSHGTRLTHLVLDIPDYDCWAVVVANCKNLICGVFDFTHKPTPLNPTRCQISNLESLRNLTLGFRAFATPAVFDYISCPNLTSLRFKAERGYCDEDWRTDAISHFSNQVRNISHLSFVDVILPNFSVALRSILQSCSASLEVLDIEDCFFDPSNESCSLILQELTIAQEELHMQDFPLFRLLSIHHAGPTVGREYLEGSYDPLKKLFGNAPLMSDSEGTLRRRGILNGVMIYTYSPFMYTHQQLGELHYHATEGADMPVRFVILVSPDEEEIECYSWQYRIEEDCNQWYEGLYY